MARVREIRLWAKSQSWNLILVFRIHAFGNNTRNRNMKSREHELSRTWNYLIVKRKRIKGYMGWSIFEMTNPSCVRNLLGRDWLPALVACLLPSSFRLFLLTGHNVSALKYLLNEWLKSESLIKSGCSILNYSINS